METRPESIKRFEVGILILGLPLALLAVALLLTWIFIPGMLGENSTSTIVFELLCLVLPLIVYFFLRSKHALTGYLTIVVFWCVQSVLFLSFLSGFLHATTSEFQFFGIPVLLFVAAQTLLFCMLVRVRKYYLNKDLSSLSSKLFSWWSIILLPLLFYGALLAFLVLALLAMSE